jgi:hypothetical protein
MTSDAFCESQLAWRAFTGHVSVWRLYDSFGKPRDRVTLILSQDGKLIDGVGVAMRRPVR